MVPLGEKLSNFTDLEDGSVSALNASLHKESLKHHDDFVTIPIEDMVDEYGRAASAGRRSRKILSAASREAKSADTADPVEVSLTSIAVSGARADDQMHSSASLAISESSTITGAAEMPHIASDSGLNDHGEMAIPASADAVQVVYVQEAIRRSARAQRTAPRRWEHRLLRMASLTQRVAYTALTLAHSLYAGLCLLSLFVFPTPYNVASGVPNAAALDATQTIDTSRLSSYVPVGPTSFNVSATEIENLTMLLSPTFQFVAFYSTVAPGMAQLFPFGAVFACLAALQAVERMRAVRVPWLDEAAALVSFVANAVMYPIDSRLIQSQTDVYGGRYGKANWFLDPAKLSTEQLLEDLQTWKQCNCVRGVFGVICWILCVLAIDRQRMHSVLDGRLRPDGRGNAWSLAALGGRRKGSDANSRAIAPV
ncbi:hypothetical protein HK105_202104 [Polyrhizophydium stewartii]|uniref:Uncharacterized protein n=1 Tax=Polyrhizophydium stewartii TaxID=2732419 RepID=A0ABR4NF92_9FUNG